MEILNQYYKAFKRYREETFSNKKLKVLRDEYKNLNVENDLFEVTKFKCKIDTDWVEEIERGLEFVEKAVLEDRQFIHTNGEIVPIEKAKKVSRDSVVHLSKHSDLIKTIPENESETLTPEKIYIVEKLSDYAVYENRFLYLLLTYLRDFIQLRIEKINIIRHTYIAKFKLNKEKIEKNELKINIDFEEKRINSTFIIPDDINDSIFNRINECQILVNNLLNRDIMIQVSKSPLIKPPIVKTNVLKMNNNFKNALALYDFIVSYNKVGYEEIEVKKVFNPFNEKLKDEFSEIISILTFLTYKNGNEIDDLLEKEYRLQEKLKKEAEQLQLKEKLKRLKQSLKENNESIDEYILALEERCRILESDSEELKLIRNEIIELNKKINYLEFEKKSLNENIKNLNNEIEKKLREIEEINILHLEEIRELNQSFENALLDKENEFNLKINDLKNLHLEELLIAKSEVENEYLLKIDNLNNEFKNIKDELNLKINNFEEDNLRLDNLISDLKEKEKALISDYELKLKDIINSYEIKVNDLNADLKNEKENSIKENENYDNKITLLNSELDALRFINGEIKPNIELTEKEKFLELEKEYKAFEKFFMEQWHLTKKQIKKEILRKKN